MIKLSNITKVFQQGSRTITALSDVTLHVPAGQIYGVIGSSGAGKSTLIRCANMLERPTSGQVLVDGQDLTSLSESELTRARRQIGMIFQHFNLLSSRTVFGNVALPLELDNTPRAEIKKRVTELLELVGLADKHDAYPANLSGGQKQLVGLAQSLIRQPSLLLLDEPLSALDLNYQFHVMDLVRRETRKRNIVTVVVVHDINIALRHGDHVLMLQDGDLIADGAPDQVITPQSLARVYGVRGRIERCSQGTPQVLIDGLVNQPTI